MEFFNPDDYLNDERDADPRADCDPSEFEGSWSEDGPWAPCHDDPTEGHDTDPLYDIDCPW